jgi:hypothetical protein
MVGLSIMLLTSRKGRENNGVVVVGRTTQRREESDTSMT